jgi:hypothetical protein
MYRTLPVFIENKPRQGEARQLRFASVSCSPCRGLFPRYNRRSIYSVITTLLCIGSVAMGTFSSSTTTQIYNSQSPTGYPGWRRWRTPAVCPLCPSPGPTTACPWTGVPWPGTRPGPWTCSWERVSQQRVWVSSGMPTMREFRGIRGAGPEEWRGERRPTRMRDQGQGGLVGQRRWTPGWTTSWVSTPPTTPDPASGWSLWTSRGSTSSKLSST